MRVAHVSDLHFVSTKTTLKIQAARTFITAATLGGAKAGGKLLGERAILNGLTKVGLGSVGMAGYFLLNDLVKYRRSYALAREVLLRQLSNEKPDHIVVSGDVTTLAADREFQEAREYVQKLASISKSGRVTIVPGNHDVPQYKQVWVRNRHGEKKLGRYLKEFGGHASASVAGGNSSAHPFPDAHMVGDICFIALDSTRVGIPLNIYGHVDSEQLDRLCDFFATPEARGSFKILVMHHQLVPPPENILEKIEDGLKEDTLKNAREVTRLVRLGKINAIFHGHVHKEYPNPDPVDTYCAGSTPALIANREQVSYRIFELRNGTLQVHERQVQMPEAMQSSTPEESPTIEDTFD